MRKITAIALLLALIAVQYAKQAVYLECRLSNFFRAACDCEKIMTGTDSNSAEAFAPSQHNHLQVDELFQPARYLTMDETGVRLILTLQRHLQIDLPHGFYTSPGHPPEKS